MKILKRKMLYMGVVFVIGLSFIAAGMLREQSMLSGIGSGMAAVSFIKLLQFLRISKNPEKVRELEIVQKEERLIYLSNRACALSYYAIILIEYLVMLVCVFLGRETIAMVCAYAVCAELILYIIIRAILNRKY